MLLETRDIAEGPIDKVFAAFADFDAHEREALKAGAEVVRGDTLAAPGVGMIWHARFMFRGKMRKVDLELVEFFAPGRIVVTGQSVNLDIVSRTEFAAVAPGRTQVTVRLDVTPRTLAARVVLQSARLARGRIQRRMGKRLRKFLRSRGFAR
ncbi:MAG: SRPBCC family protein [Rhodobacteraceae bacterium]|nr:SRPBCC family protein [Paracoccaceae bacterium]